MLAFAIEGITSLSIKPIRLITFAGIASFFVSIGFLVWAVVDFYRGNTVSGWASIMVSIWFIGGLLLLFDWNRGRIYRKDISGDKAEARYLVETRLDDREAETRNDEERSAEDEDREESGTGNG